MDIRQADTASAELSPAVESLADLARRTLHARKLRLAHLPATMFGEPAWDMMLALYQDQHQVRHHIKRLCSVSGAPATTALRWIEYLERAGLVARRASPVDKRVVFIELSAAGQHAIEKYLVDLRESSVAPSDTRNDHRLSPGHRSGKLAE